MLITLPSSVLRRHRRAVLLEHSLLGEDIHEISILPTFDMGCILYMRTCSTAVNPFEPQSRLETNGVIYT